MTFTLDVPVDPDADTAREWAVDELSKGEYQPQSESLFQRIADWINNVLGNIGVGDAGFSTGQIIIGIVVIALIVWGVVALVVGPIRRSRRGAHERAVFEDDERSSESMRAASEAAAAAGHWGPALLERYRCVVRSLEERELLDVRPGMTAHEAAVATSSRFPDVKERMAAASDDFDEVRYGRGDGTPEKYQNAVELDRTLRGRSLLRTAAP